MFFTPLQQEIYKLECTIVQKGGNVMIRINTALTQEEQERIKREINELLDQNEQIIEFKKIRKIIFGSDIIYVVFGKDYDLLYQPKTEKPRRKESLRKINR